MTGYHIFNRHLSRPFGLLLGVMLLVILGCSLALPALALDTAARGSLKPLYTAADKTPAPLDEAALINALQQVNPAVAPAETNTPVETNTTAEPDTPVETAEKSTPPPAEAADKPAEPTGVFLEVPSAYSANTGFKSFMDYRAITNRRSRQYALQQQAHTDEQGFRVYDGYYMVALGTFYAQSVGERFRITLEGGQSFLAITGDIKSNAHTDSRHQHRGGNIIEFIVDRRAISGMCLRMGDMSYAGFSGRIASIEKLN